MCASSVIGQPRVSFTEVRRPQGLNLPDASPHKNGSDKFFDDFNQTDGMQAMAVATDVNATIRNAIGIPIALLKGPVALLTSITTALQGLQCVLLLGFLIKSLPETYTELVKAIKNTAVSPEIKSQLIKDSFLKFLNQVSLLVIALAFGGLAITGGIALGGIIASASIAAAAAFELILGAICVFRGIVITIKCTQAFRHAREFEKDFKEALQTKDKMKMIHVLNQEIGKGGLNSRMIKAALETFLAKDQKSSSSKAQEVLRKLQADKGLELSDFDDETLTEKLLQVIDRGVFEEKLKQAWMGVIGVLMSVGGVLSILSCCSIVGLPAGIVASVSCGVFLSMEAGWIPVDSSRAFRWLADKTYTEDQKIRGIYEKSIGDAGEDAA